MTGCRIRNIADSVYLTFEKPRLRSLTPPTDRILPYLSSAWSNPYVPAEQKETNNNNFSHKFWQKNIEVFWKYSYVKSMSRSRHSPVLVSFVRISTFRIVAMSMMSAGLWSALNSSNLKCTRCEKVEQNHRSSTGHKDNAGHVILYLHGNRNAIIISLSKLLVDEQDECYNFQTVMFYDTRVWTAYEWVVEWRQLLPVVKPHQSGNSKETKEVHSMTTHLWEGVTLTLHSKRPDSGSADGLETSKQAPKID